MINPEDNHWSRCVFELPKVQYMDQDWMGNSFFEISVCASSFGEIHGNFYDSKLPYKLPDGNISKDAQVFFDNALQDHLKAAAFCYIKHNLKFSDRAKETLDFVKSFHENCEKMRKGVTKLRFFSLQYKYKN